MLISVILLGGMLLGASAVTGTLLAYQIRQANDALKSAKALFAADAGMEAASFCVLKNFRCPSDKGSDPGYSENRYPMQYDFLEYREGNGPEFTIVKSVNEADGVINIVSKGTFSSAVRAFEAFFEGAEPDGVPPTEGVTVE